MVGKGIRATVLFGILAILLSAFVSPAQASSSDNRDKGERHRSVVTPASVATRSGPTSQDPNFDGQDGGLLANFNGVSSLDSEITNFGAKFEPPDQGLCVGNGFVVEMVNSAFRIYDVHGHTLQGPTNVNAPFHEDFLAFTSDPRCHYDAATNTWFAIILFINFVQQGPNVVGTDSHLDIAWNTTGDPTTDWSVFRIDTTDAHAPASSGCPCFGDQPRLGIDASNIYVSQDEFSINGPQFNGFQILAISKRDLVRHSKKVHFVEFSNLSANGEPVVAAQPAITIGPSPAEYFMGALDPNLTQDNRIEVWALTHGDRVGQGGMPTLSSVILTSEPYAVPLQQGAAQQGSAITLNPDDDRMQQTQFINGEIWGELDTALTPAGDTAQHDGAAWFRVRPELSHGKLGGASITAQGYLSAKGRDLLYPALQSDGQGHAAMVFTLTGSDMFPSAAYSTMNEEESGFGRPVVVAEGTGPYVNNSFRWGDYSWAIVDPGSDSVWMATEYMPPKSSQTTTGRRPWGTRVFQVALQQKQ